MLAEIYYYARIHLLVVSEFVNRNVSSNVNCIFVVFNGSDMLDMSLKLRFQFIKMAQLPWINFRTD